MRKAATIACLGLLIAGPLSIWSTAMEAHCPLDHDATAMRAAMDCALSACCATPARTPLPDRDAGAKTKVAPAIADAFIWSAALAAALEASEPAARGPSPGAGRPAPTLRR